MRSLSRIFIFILGILILITVTAMAQSDQTTGAIPPIAQPLIREGDFAIDLAVGLKLGTSQMSETEAESKLTSIGIMPQNGWIADYPVTPDVVGELQTSLSAASDSGKLSLGKDTAMSVFQDVLKGDNISVNAAVDQSLSETPGTNYPESSDVSNYYETEGPPAVTYYSPPPDYAYLYTWVPYPFWYSDFWFPGFFVLVDFDIRVHGHDHGHSHWRFISNHFQDPRTGKMSRIDPTSRSRGGTFAEAGDMRRSSPSAQKGAQAIFNKIEANRPFRGYGVVSRPSAGTRSSAFEGSANSRFERAASDRGFQSRSKAGQITSRGSTAGGGYHGGGWHGRSR